ncbi:MAG: hypothetical protein WB608_16185 [Terracidiphilus sp.]
MRLFDGFAGRLGWSRAFLERGWTVTAVDLVVPPEVPDGVEFIQGDMLEIDAAYLRQFDFACFSSPCDQFSVHGMKHFHPNPPYPELGIKLFNHSRSIAEESGIPYVMENVRAAQQFVGSAANHCGPFYLWGSGVPTLMPQGVKKGFQTGGGIIQKLKRIDRKALTDYRRQNDLSWSSSGSKKRKEFTALAATIPPELSACVADYAERILEQKAIA